MDNPQHHDLIWSHPNLISKSGTVGGGLRPLVLHNRVKEVMGTLTLLSMLFSLGC